MYVNGIETPIIVDDYFPVKYGQPAFCNTNSEELWGMIMEKAWAKLHGSYSRVEGGQTAHASQHVIGLPALTFDHKDAAQDIDSLWKKLKIFDKRNFVILSSSPPGGNDKTVNGIVQGHAYSLLSVHEINAYGRNWRLVKMRNPWGRKGEWDGEWSD